MLNPENFKSEIFFLNSDSFESAALSVFDYQYHHNIVYKQFCDHLGVRQEKINTIQDIPFLPIEFFKTQRVVSEQWNEQKIFKSSGTSGQNRSQHFVKDIAFYHRIALTIFENLYGSISNLQILALLPSYQQQGDSSLISMVDFFMSQSIQKSHYLLENPESLIETIQDEPDTKKLVIGVSYAFLDILESSDIPAHENLTIMETGGMKGRRKEMIRNELHDLLKAGFHVNEIHSEYGMTELTSQAYGSNGYFQLPSWCKAVIRDINDPFIPIGNDKTGGLNIIDLANIHSCAFIETKDLAKTHANGTFEVLGRFDNSDIRGCNLLVN